LPVKNNHFTCNNINSASENDKKRSLFRTSENRMKVKINTSLLLNCGLLDYEENFYPEDEGSTFAIHPRGYKIS
jgi:hypothetical protein